MTTADAERFGRVVNARRRVLGLNPQQVHDAGGPAPTTLSKIENGAAGKLYLSTFQKLDTGLRWQPGSAASAHDHGTTPVPVNGIGPESVKVPTPVYVAFPPGVIEEVCGIAKDLEMRAAADGQLSEISVGLDRVADRILRAWTIAEIERMRVAGSLETLPVETLLGHYMRRTPLAPTPEDHEELMYMRWLLCRLPADCSEEMELRFAARWNRVRQMLTNHPVLE
ncbi:hypothetical protein OG225_42775 (plasmid) [Nocardia sp. NBC_01377]|uniref:hypothetical protein n=1 Tax=Nocardia sp. NBC_01377 TaxID=2903595 RepID=UPI002F919051